jgi:peroxiredoxin Q/BCP
MLQKGDEAPEFELLDSEGKKVSLSDYRGRRVVLFFYPRADTPGCTVQACGFRDNFPRIQASDGVVLGISPDMPAALARWKKKLQLPYDLLSDPDHQTAEAYGVWGEKSSYGIKRMGILRSHFVVGPDGRLEDVQVRVSPTDSVERALETVAG